MEEVKQRDIETIQDKYNCLIDTIMERIKNKTLSEGTEIIRTFISKQTDTDIKFKIIDSTSGSFVEDGINKFLVYYYKSDEHEHSAIGYIESFDKDKKEFVEWKSYSFLG